MVEKNNAIGMVDKIIPISYIRALAALLIFACHVTFIAGDFEIAMWLNTGVPTFFIISAYLLSLKSKDIKKAAFYKKGLKAYTHHILYI